MPKFEGMEKEAQQTESSSLFSRFLKLGWIPNIKWLRRILVGIIGFTVLLIGIAMIVLPGPAFLVIPLGLAILATEFVWAEALLKKAKTYFDKGKDRLTGRNKA